MWTEQFAPGIDITNYVRLLPEDLHPEGIQNLKEAILKRAADDWREAVKIRLGGNCMNCFGREQQECERFFLSEWFFFLTGLNGRIILVKLRKEMGI